MSDISVSRGVRMRRSQKWTKLSRQVRAAHPWCVRCGATEDLTVDHIVPLDQGGATYDRANLEVMCRRHNSVKGARVPVDRPNRADPPDFSLSPYTPPFPKPKEIRESKPDRKAKP